MKAIDRLHTGAQSMPIQQAQILLAVALQPGLTTENLKQYVALEQSSFSRNLAALGKWHRLGHPGANFIEASEDPHERRRKVYHLTPQGRRAVQSALEALAGEPVDFTSPTAREALDGIHRSV